MIIDILQKKIRLVNKEYNDTLLEINSLELQIKDLDMEKITLERKVMELHMKLDKIESDVMRDVSLLK